MIRTTLNKTAIALALTGISLGTIGCDKEVAGALAKGANTAKTIENSTSFLAGCDYVAAPTTGISDFFEWF